MARVAVRLPPFWSERPDVWFSQADAQFSLASITSDTTKFHYVVSQLDQRYAEEVDDLITSPSQLAPYSTLRSILMRLSPLLEQRHHQLLHLEDMGDRKPSLFLRHLCRLAPDVQDSLLRSLWTSCLPSAVQATLICLPETSLNSMAELADRLVQTIPLHTPHLSSTAP
jgi:hypothetical protein